jgi:hypothetical protein
MTDKSPTPAPTAAPQTDAEKLQALRDESDRLRAEGRITLTGVLPAKHTICGSMSTMSITSGLPPLNRGIVFGQDDSGKPVLSHPASSTPSGDVIPFKLALNVKHPDCHKAADAFWGYWNENGETHKRGYYESTWGAINRAIRMIGVVPHNYGESATATSTKGATPCTNAAHMGEHACSDRSQCWEPCGELGKSAEHAKVWKGAAAAGEAITDAMVDAYLTAQREQVQKQDAQPFGMLDPRAACHAGLKAALATAPTPQAAATTQPRVSEQADAIRRIVDRDTPPDNRDEVVDHDIRGNPITRGDVARFALTQQAAPEAPACEQAKLVCNPSPGSWVSEQFASPAATTASASGPLNGIKATMTHDEGAFARCSYCGRYSLDPATLSDRQPVCDCGKQHGWSGSFVRPDAHSRWSGQVPEERIGATAPVPSREAAPQGEREKFEAWMGASNLARFQDGSYADAGINKAWAGWQEALAQQSREAAPLTVSLDAILDCYSPDDTVGDYQDKIRRIYAAAHAAHAGADAERDTLIRLFLSAAYPVSTEIDARGYRWSEAYLDQARAAALAQQSADLAAGGESIWDDNLFRALFGEYETSEHGKERENLNKLIAHINAKLAAARASGSNAGVACTYPNCACIGGGVFKPCVKQASARAGEAVRDGWKKPMRDLVRVLRGVECGDDGQWKFIANVCANADELLAAAPSHPDKPADTNSTGETK